MKRPECQHEGVRYGTGLKLAMHVETARADGGRGTPKLRVAVCGIAKTNQELFENGID